MDEDLAPATALPGGPPDPKNEKHLSYGSDADIRDKIRISRDPRILAQQGVGLEQHLHGVGPSGFLDVCQPSQN